MEQSGVEFVLLNLAQFIDGMNRAQKGTNAMSGALKALEKASDIGKLITGLGLAMSSFAPQVGLVTAAVGLVISGLSELGILVGGKIGAAISGLARLVQGLSNAFMSVIRPVADFIGKILDTINPIRMLMDFLDRVLYIGLGILTADIFRSIARGIRDIAQEAFDAATNFQLLQIRLQSFAVRDVVEGLMEAGQTAFDYAAIFKQVESSVQDAYNWIVKTAAITPFTIESITNVYALARSYNFTEDQAKSLVETIGNFSAAMGLSDTEMKRIIVNLGQMQQLGKITQRELNDLARGAFVPVNQILEQMAKNLDVSSDALQSMMRAGTVGVEEFNLAFQQVIARDFPDAMRRMFQTIPGIISGLHDVTQALFGFKILGPTMDTLAEKLSVIFIDILQDPRLYQLVDELGLDLERLVDGLWPEELSGASIMDKIWEGYQKLRTVVGFLTQGDWQKALQSLGVPDFVITSIESLQTAFENMKIFWDQNGDELIGIIERVMGTLGFDKLEPSQALPTITSTIKGFSEWLIENGPRIVEIVDGIGKSIEHFATVTIPLLAGSLEGSVNFESLGFFDKLAFTLNRLAIIGAAMIDSIIISLQSLDDSMGGAGTAASLFDATLKFLVVSFSLFAALVAGTVNAITTTLEHISTAFSTVILGIGIFKQGLENLFSGNFAVGIQEIFTGIQTAITGFIMFLSYPLTAILGFVQGVITFFQQLSDELVGHSIIPEMWDGIVSEFVNGVAEIIAAVVGAISQITSAILGWVPEIDEALRQIAKTFYNRAQGWIQQAILAIESMTDALIDAITAMISAVQGAIKGIVIPITWGNPGSPPSIPGMSSTVRPGPSGSGGACFVGGTLVTMADGSPKKIELVQVGDMVLSRDVNTGRDFPAQVEEVFHHRPDEMGGFLEINDGLLCVTPEHPVYVVNRNDWIKAGELQEMDWLWNAHQQIVIVKKSMGRSERVPVYNLHTDHESHNYFANEILVHNAQRKARGGDVTAGMDYIVGDAGRPEWFAPSQDGHIFPSIEAAVGAAVEKMTTAFSRAVNAQISTMAMQAVPGSVGNTTNYNVNVNANYQNPQSPVGISHDIDAILARTRL